MVEATVYALAERALEGRSLNQSATYTV